MGLGWVAKACLHCKECLRGRNFTCLNVEQFGTANLDTGTFSTGLTRDVSWLIKIPDAIPSEFAGPLTCGGATVWQPLYEHGLKAGDRVGIIGIGGLGHLAIQFAAKMGMEVIVFSTTAAKKDEAMKFGATEFWPTKDVKELKDVKPLQSLIITTSVLPDFALYVFFPPGGTLAAVALLTGLYSYFPILAPDCKIFPLTVSMDSASIPMLPFIVQNLRIVGTTGAQKFSTDQMMEFAAKHGIRPQIETFEMTQKGITEAMQKLKEGKMRYRGVVVRPDLM